MFTVTPDVQVKRNATAYTRVQPLNKQFIEKESKRLGFKSTAAYVDAVFTKLRAEAPAAKKAAAPKKAAKKPYKVKRK